MDFDDTKKTIFVILASFFAIAASGVGMGFIYYFMDVTDSHMQTISCTINNNVFVSSCQELFDLSLYPFLALKNIIVIFSAIFILILTVGVLTLGYQSGKQPWTIGILVLGCGLLTYLGNLLANMYIRLLENTIIYTMMLEFSVYNKVMLNFPWFIFIVSIFSVMLSIVNYQRTSVNRPTTQELNY